MLFQKEAAKNSPKQPEVIEVGRKVGFVEEIILSHI